MHANPATENAEKEEIRLLVSNINQAWLKGNLAKLRDFFHDGIIIKGPQFETMGTGKDACIKSYEDFLRAATVSQFKESDAQVDLFGPTAVATFAWEIIYEMNGGNFHETGHDVFVFVRSGEGWKTVWRAMMPTPASQ